MVPQVRRLSKNLALAGILTAFAGLFGTRCHQVSPETQSTDRTGSTAHETSSRGFLGSLAARGSHAGVDASIEDAGHAPPWPQTEAEPVQDAGPPEVRATKRYFAKSDPRAVRGTSGIVVSVEPSATRVGVQILEAGGNAVDAAVAVAFALAVTHASAGNLGGGGFWLIHKPGEPTAALDFREVAPAHFERSRFDAMIRAGGSGPDSVGVPGTVAGLVEAHRRFGRLTWAQVTAPSIRLAAKGHRVYETEAKALERSWPILKKDRYALSLFENSGHGPPKVGTWVRRTALSTTLEEIQREGRNGFYRGAVAESIISALGDPAQLSLADLDEYQPRWRVPRQLTYRGLMIETMPLPSAGGVALTESLKLLEQFDVSSLGSVQRTHLLLEIERRADHDRILRAADPESLSASQLQSLEARYTSAHTWDTFPIDIEHATASLGTSGVAVATESPNTTHFSLVDSEGMLVSATMTLSAAFGAKIVTSTGIVLNNTLASFSQSGLNQPHPRQRTTSSMAPTLVFDSVGPVMVLGTPGGDTIPSTLLEVLSNLVDRGMTLPTAIDAPRFHQSCWPDRSRFENSHPLASSTRKDLTRMGHLWAATPKQGHANCILLGESGALGYADPREGGLALAAHSARNANASDARRNSSTKPVLDSHPGF